MVIKRWCLVSSTQDFAQPYLLTRGRSSVSISDLVSKHLGCAKSWMEETRHHRFITRLQAFHITQNLFRSRWLFSTPPPILRHFSFQDLVTKLLHTRSVERCVKIVTEAAAYVRGEDNRHKTIRAKLSGYMIMINLKFETKTNYSVNTTAGKINDLPCSTLPPLLHGILIRLPNSTSFSLF